MKIKFRRAASSADYKLAHALMRNENAPKQSLGFPTMLAFEGDKLVGILGTSIQNNMIVAGPLLLRSDKRRAFTALHLCVEYEEDLHTLGIKSYIFSAEEGGIMEEAVKRYMHGMEPYAIENGRKFYIRRLDKDQSSPSLLKGPIGVANGQQG
jgi:hypothetical protein